MLKDKHFIRGIILLLIFAVIICGVSFAGGFFTGRAYVNQSGDFTDSGRAVEYGRQMGLVDEGLGRIQQGISRIAGAVSADAADLRGRANALITIAGEVKEMEDTILVLRSGISGFVDNNDK